MESVTSHIKRGTRTPFTSVYLVRPGIFSEVPENVVLCILLDDETIEDFKASFTALRMGDYKFMISFHAEKQFEEGVRLLIQSMFCLNYHTEGGEPVLALTQAPNLFPEISRRLKSQGYHAFISWPSFETGNITNDGLTLTRYPSNLDPAEWLQNVLASDFRLLTGYVVISGNDIAACSMIDRVFQDTWTDVSEADKLYSETVAGYVRARNDRAALSAENKKLKRQLKGAETTIGVIRTKYKDDYENLFAWYHNEYEILPLWYKRFGHILKVIMGKRTFRSLFSDDVKKYKN